VRFSAGAVGALKHYVYVYVDPTTDEIFYIGKGVGNRAFTHLARSDRSRTTAKIRALRRQGLAPRVDILVHGLPDDRTARKIESAVIDVVGVRQLTNEVRGVESTAFGRMEAGELSAAYSRRRVDVREPAMLIRISRRYRHGMTPIELYDVTRGVWRCGPDRAKARYAFAVFDGIVKEIYEIERWFPAGRTFSTRNPRGVRNAARWEFVGRRAPERMRARYLNRSVQHHFRGSQAPFVYVSLPE
jgi:uncharacterized protein